ncbi:Ig-like domain-containing protein [Prauserella oleivorans]|uniref:Ig-like domain-containing protein n=1 Tax=Prauserella oleivorans TaxID=1478153 RepID=A0ABW5WEQ2_9PSEU
MGRRGGYGPRRWVRLAAMVTLGSVLGAGCTPTANEETSSDGPATTAVARPASLILSVAPGAHGVEPAGTVTATAQGGTITQASLVGTRGTVVEGAITPDGTAWRSAEPLGYGKTYTLTATARGADGTPVTRRSTFTTATPQRQVSVSMNVSDGQTVGVGMPLIFSFSGDITDRSAAEQAVRITTEPATEGAFRWFDDDQLIWRPKEYWRPGTTVSVEANVYGRDLGDGTYGTEDRAATLTIGDKVVAIADGETHHMSVFVNDRRLRRLPISMGKPSSSTPNGTYTVMSEHYGYTMDSSTYGVPVDSGAGYRLWVEYAVRLSYSGIFYHSAPWSVGYQGNTNTSHGCINLSTEDAAWLMERSQPGDVVTVRNAGEQVLEPTDGWSVWQLSWEEWTAAGA